MKSSIFAIRIKSIVLAAVLLAGVTTSDIAHANILLQDNGEWLIVRYTLKGAYGQVMRVRRTSVEGRQALWFARLAVR